jgi:hypothetical protein
MGLLRPDAGEARVLGQSLWEATREHRQACGRTAKASRCRTGMSLSDLGRDPTSTRLGTNNLLKEHALPLGDCR